MASQSIQPSAANSAPWELTNNDLAPLLNALNSAVSKCFALGLQLGVKYPVLRKIEYNYRRCEDQLREIISERLRQESPLTWHDIVRALRTDSVSENRLASEIENKYIHRQPPSASVVPQTNTISPTTCTSAPSLSSLPAGQCNTSPLASPSMKYPFDQITINASQPPPSISQQERDGSSIQTSTHNTTHAFSSSQQSHYTLRTDQLLSREPLVHSAYYPPVRLPRYLTHCPPQCYPVPVIPPPTTQPPSVHSEPWGTHKLPSHLSVPPPLESVTNDRWSPQPHTNQSQSSSANERTVLLQMFIDYVKTIYKESEVERDTKVVKWPPTPSTVFINLACINRKSVSGKSREYADITMAMVYNGDVDTINTTKGPMDFNEVARGISIPSGKLSDSHATEQRRLILVEGAPGVGKSTFAWEFCRRWERGDIAQQYHLVLLLKLRDDRIVKAKTLNDIIYHPLEGVPRAVSEELVCSNFHALIILEGFDELPNHCRKDESIFFQLIAGKLLPLATVLVTSRPWATRNIRCKYGNRIYQHVEILGFTRHQITEYIEKTLPQDGASDLKAYLEKHPQIRMGMYIPLNSAIVVTVYQESQESGCALPTTLTELYTALVRTLLLRYLRSHPQYETAIIQTFNDLPPAVYAKFSDLCKLAYTGIVNSDHLQLIFTDLSPDFDSLGLMDSVTELYVTQGTVSSHNFLHLTFQEYFAAVHISTLSPSEQLEHFMRHKEGTVWDGRLKVILTFLAGLKQLHCFSKENVHNFLIGKSSNSYTVSVDVKVTNNLVNWMFEAQSNDALALLLGKKTVEFDIEHCVMLPMDYYSLGYCIAHSQCQWVLISKTPTFEINGLENVYRDRMGKEDMRMLKAGANTTEQPGGRIVLLTGREWPEQEVSVEVLNMLFTEWKSVLHVHELALRLPVACDSITWPNLSALRVLSLYISHKTSWKLDTLLPHLSLEGLIIQSCSSDVGLTFEDCVAVGKYIASATCLKGLLLQYENDRIYRTGVGLDRKGLEIITKALAGNNSLPLEGLELRWDCTFTDTAAQCLAQFISNSTTLKYFTIGWCTFNAHGLLQLARALHGNSTLENMTLEDSSCTVGGDDEAEYFAQLLVEYPQVELEGAYKYNITITQISDVGAINLARALHCNCSLEMLNLSNNNISDVGAIALARALHHNSTLKVLYLSNNIINDAGAVALAQVLQHNSTLKALDLYGNNGVSEKGIHQLVQALTVNSSVYVVVLPRNVSSLPHIANYIITDGELCFTDHTLYRVD